MSVFLGRRIIRRSVVWLGLWLLLGSLEASSWAQRPVSVPPGKAGYRVVISEHPALGIASNLLVVEIEKAPKLKAVADEVLTVSIDGVAFNGQLDHRRSFSKQVVIPAGSTGVKTEVPFQFEMLHVYEASVRLERGVGDGRFNRNDLLRCFYPMHSSEPVSCWLIDSKAKSDHAGNVTQHFCWDGMERRDQLVNGIQYAQAVASPTRSSELGYFLQSDFLGENFFNAETELGLRSLPFDGPPENFDAWYGVDLIMFRFGELKKFCRQDERRQRLERWVAGGGMLCVFGEGDFAYVPEILPVLVGGKYRNKQGGADWIGTKYEPVNPQLADAQLNAIPQTAAATGPQWDGTQWVISSQAASEMYWDGVVEFVTNPIATWPKPDQLKESLKPYGALTSRYLNGRVIAFRSTRGKSRAKVKNKYRRNEFDVLSSARIQLRRPQRPSCELSANAASPIPGVGEPPIMLFIGVLFAFLLVVGPITVFYVRFKGGYAYRLFFAVPLVSFLTCALILSYSYIINLGAQSGRLESYTMIDPSSGMAFNQTTLAYFCGDQPRSYQFDPDVYVASGVTGDDRFLKMVDLDDNQLLSSDRISPRRLHYVFAEQTGKLDVNLVVRKPASGEPVVTNRLGSRIELAAIRSGKQLYLVQDLAEGATANAQLTTPKTVQELLNEYQLDYRVDDYSFGRRRSEFFYTSHVSRVFRSIGNSFYANAPDDLIPADDDFIAVVDDDPMSAKVAAPFDYKMKRHIIHGKH